MSSFIARGNQAARQQQDKSPHGGKDLRDQLHSEIESKFKSCSNPTFECSLPRIDGYEYCMRHILRDARAPFRQCSYNYANGKRCVNALLKTEGKKDASQTTYCFEHSRQAQLQKTHALVGRLKQTESNETLLQSLTHHLLVEELAAAEQDMCGQDEVIDVVSHVEPFVSHKQINDLANVQNMFQRKRPLILDYASDSESSHEETMSNTKYFDGWKESDNESVDSEDDDVLKHAGVFTRLEAISISETKLSKLQQLYLSQINRLNHKLKTKRRVYLNSLRKERETLCSIHDQIKDTPEERKLYDELKALNKYHRRTGTAAVLDKKLKEKRARNSNDIYVQKLAAYGKCIYTEGGVKCGERALPFCKFCRKHVLEDKRQILFRACDKEKGGVVCKEPIPHASQEATCVLHVPIPPRREYVQKKYESETDEEELLFKTEMHDDAAAVAPEEQSSSKINEEDNSMQTEADVSMTTDCNVTISHEQECTEQSAA